MLNGVTTGPRARVVCESSTAIMEQRLRKSSLSSSQLECPCVRTSCVPCRNRVCRPPSAGPFFLAKVVYYRMNQRHPFLITPVVVAGVGRDDQEGQRSEVAHHSLESLRMLATALAACKYKRPCLVCGGNTCTVTALSAQACMTMPKQSRTA